MQPIQRFRTCLLGNSRTKLGKRLPISHQEERGLSYISKQFSLVRTANSLPRIRLGESRPPSATSVLPPDALEEVIWPSFASWSRPQSLLPFPPGWLRMRGCSRLSPPSRHQWRLL